MKVQKLVVNGREIKYKIDDIPIDDLCYYEENPRINYIVSKYPKTKVTQAFIEKELIKLDSTKDRIRDIEDNQGLIDEVYVIGNEVVEGNTRLCAYRRLSKKYPDDEKWKKIKARVLIDEVNDEELFYILGTFHLKGKTPWDAYEKAAYVHKMIKVLKKSPQEIASQVGKQKKSIEAMLRAYETMSDKYLIDDNDDSNMFSSARDELKKYSYFEAFFLQNDLVKRADETPEFLNDFVEMVREDRFLKAQNVRLFPKILSNKKACRAFYELDPDDAFDEALYVLHRDRPDKVDRFYKKVRDFRNLINDSAISNVKEDVEENKNKKNELVRCYREFSKFIKEIGLD